MLESAKPNSARGSRLAMFRSRFKKAKDLSTMGESDLASILGANDRRPDRLRADRDALKAKAEEEQKKRAAEADYQGTNAAESVGDYFARMAAKRAAGGGAEPSPSPADDKAAAKEARRQARKAARKAERKAARQPEPPKPEAAGRKRKADKEAEGGKASKKKKEKKKKRQDKGSAS